MIHSPERTATQSEAEAAASSSLILRAIELRRGVLVNAQEVSQLPQLGTDRAFAILDEAAHGLAGVSLVAQPLGDRPVNPRQGLGRVSISAQLNLRIGHIQQVAMPLPGVGFTGRTVLFGECECPVWLALNDGILDTLDRHPRRAEWHQELVLESGDAGRGGTCEGKHFVGPVMPAVASHGARGP